MASAQLSHCYALVSCPVTLLALMNVLAVSEDSVDSRMRVAVVPAISHVILMQCKGCTASGVVHSDR